LTFFGIPYKRLQVLYFFGDLLVALVSLYLGHALRLAWDGQSMTLLNILDVTTGASVLFVLSHLLFLYIADAYNSSHDYREPPEVLRLLLAVGAAWVVQMALYYAIPQWQWGRGISGLGTFTFGVLVVVWRAAASSWRPNTNRRRTLIVGAGTGGHALGRAMVLDRRQSGKYDPIGFLDDAVTVTEDGLPPVLGRTPDLDTVVREHGIQEVVVTIRGGMPLELTNSLLNLKARGVDISDMPSVYKRLTGKVPVRHMVDSEVIFGPDFSYEASMTASVARLVDIFVALLGLVLSSVPLLLCAVAIKLTDRGPVFYSQERIGLNEVPFTIHKLRTMRTDAEKDGVPKWSKGKGDPRVTLVGKFLRRSRLDELPQFWNILTGDMSLVGPRPERQHFVDQLKEEIPYYGLRFSVKPGVTGWAQVMYRYGATTEDAEEKLRYELYSIQEMSLVLYLLIALKTVQTVLLRPGS